MYKYIFDYDKEFEFYDAVLKRNSCRKILEIGCGSGMLARWFISHRYDYFGRALFNEMLEIARAGVKDGKFIRCDMRNLTFDPQFDSVLITGRSLAYVIENKGIADTFNGVYKALKANGLFVFGVFEAHGIFDNFNDFEQTIELNLKKIKRISKLKMNLTTGWTYHWYARYIVEEENKVSEFDDLTTLRAFTRDEISLFMKLTGFQVNEIINDENTFTVIAEKAGPNRII